MIMKDLALVMGAAVVSSAATQLLVFGNPVVEAKAESEAKPALVYQAQAFEIVNDKGKVEARFGYDTTGAASLWSVNNAGKTYPVFVRRTMSDESLVAGLREAIAETEAKEEHKANEVEVEHILISFAESGVPDVSRSLKEAEEFTGEVYRKLLDGEDFSDLREAYSDDTGPGIYTMVTKGEKPGQYLRGQMVPAFGNVGWRLEVGEVGIANFDSAKSPYGYHIVKRLK